MWGKFSYQFLICFVFLLTCLNAKEVTISVSIESDNTNLSELDPFFKSKAIEEISVEYLKSSNCSSADYLKKLKENFPEKESMLAFEKKVGSNFQIVYLMGEKASESKSFTARLSFEFNEEPVRTNCFLWTEDLKDYQDLILFFDVSVENSGKLSLVEKKALREVSTIDYFFDLWHPIAVESFSSFPEIALMDQLTKQKVSRYFEYLNSKNVLIYFKIFYEKLYESTRSNKIEYRLKNHLVIKDLKTDSILYTFDFPVLKKTFDSVKAKNLSKIIIDQSVNELKKEIETIDKILEDFLAKGSLKYLLSIKNVSSITDANILKSLFEEKLKEFNIQIQFNRISNSEIVLELVSSRGVKWSEIFKGRFSKLDFKEKKVLVFDANSNSFAIMDN